MAILITDILVPVIRGRPPQIPGVETINVPISVKVVDILRWVVKILDNTHYNLNTIFHGIKKGGQNPPSV